MIDKFLKRFLRQYDRNRFLGVISGFAVVIPVVLLMTWVLAALAYLGLHETIVICVGGAIGLLLFRFFVWVPILAVEAMWSVFGVYWLFGISGRPLRDSLSGALERKSK